MRLKSYVNDVSITPLAIPMICGPGAISNAIILMQDAETIEKKGVLIATIAIVLLLTFVILYSSGRIIKLLGVTGNNVMMRLMGLIVMVIAVEFFFSGLKPILADIIHP
jgi:multiple antibiotic resistance protein